MYTKVYKFIYLYIFLDIYKQNITNSEQKNYSDVNACNSVVSVVSSVAFVVAEDELVEVMTDSTSALYSSSSNPDEQSPVPKQTSMSLYVSGIFSPNLNLRI